MPIVRFPAAASGGSGAWGSITGTLSSQTDLNDALNGKQATLVSATNIKTINSTSLLGAGDIAISGSVPDGDKGDITVSVSGATWTIDNNAVTTAKITDSNVTLAKIQDIATNRILGRSTAGSGVTEALTLLATRTLLNVEDGADVTDNANVITALNNIASVAEGDVLYFNGTNWVRLARGTDGQVLTATATTINWENASGGGHTTDATLTQATSAYDIAGKDVRITLSSGTTGSINTFIDMATAGKEGHIVEIKNSAGANYTITTTSLSNFIGGSYIIPDGGVAEFFVRRNLLTTTFDQTTHIHVGNAGAYS